VCTSLDGFEDLGDFYFIEQSDPNRVAARIVRLCREELPGKFNLDPIHDIQVLTPMHKGSVGTINLNQMLQKLLNPQPVSLGALGNAFKIGDKVMHLINNYPKRSV
jgi:exodeoxyribonuclease V alpha subunit